MSHSLTFRLPYVTMVDMNPYSKTRVEKASAELARYRTRLEREVREAHKDGASLRAIAEWANISHEQVRRIVTSQPLTPAQ